MLCVCAQVLKVYLTPKAGYTKRVIPLVLWILLSASRSEESRLTTFRFSAILVAVTDLGSGVTPRATGKTLLSASASQDEGMIGLTLVADQDGTGSNVVLLRNLLHALLLEQGATSASERAVGLD